MKLKEVKKRIDEYMKTHGEDMNVQIDDFDYDETCDEIIAIIE